MAWGRERRGRGGAWCSRAELCGVDAAGTPIPAVGAGVLSPLHRCADTALMASVRGCSSPARRVSAEGGFPSPGCFISWCPKPRLTPSRWVAVLHTGSPTGTGSPPAPTLQPTVADVSSQSWGSCSAPAERPCPGGAEHPRPRGVQSIPLLEHPSPWGSEHPCPRAPSRPRAG